MCASPIVGPRVRAALWYVLAPTVAVAATYGCVRGAMTLTRAAGTMYVRTCG
jgi:hypothetical protein